MCHVAGMPSVNIRQLRETRRLKAWLQAGETVELRDRDRMIARIVPVNGAEWSGEMPDFAARARKILGGRVLPDALAEVRKRARY